MGIIFLLVYLYFVYKNFSVGYEKYKLWVMFKEQEYLKDTFIFCGIGVLLIVIAIIIIIVSMKLGNKEKKGMNEWLDKEMNGHNINKDDIKLMLQGIERGYYLILTKDNRLFIFNNYLRKSESVKIQEILKIKIDAIINEKNKMHVIALTPTFSKHTKLIAIEFKIVTENKTHIVRYEPKGQHPDGSTIKTINAEQDEMERFKLLIEKEMKNLNKSN